MAKTGAPALGARTSAAPGRLVEALILGALIGGYTNLSVTRGIDAVIVGTALMLPPFFAVARDRFIGRKGPALACVVAFAAAVGTVLTLAAVLLSSGVGLRAIDKGVYVTGAMVLVPLTVAFTVGSVGDQVRPAAGLAVGCGALAWLGAGIHNLILPFVAGMVAQTDVTGNFGHLVFAIELAVFGLGFAWAVVAGVIGAAARTWIVRTFSAPAAVRALPYAR
jgi:hypothetical protein